MIGVIPVSTQSASCEVVLYAFAIFMLVSLCICLSFKALLFHCMLSIQTRAAYDNMGKIAPEYIILSTSCHKPQFTLADFDRAWMNLMHFPVMYSMCALKLNRPSFIMPRDFIVFSWRNYLLLRYIL